MCLFVFYQIFYNLYLSSGYPAYPATRLFLGIGNWGGGILDKYLGGVTCATYKFTLKTTKKQKKRTLMRGVGEVSSLNWRGRGVYKYHCQGTSYLQILHNLFRVAKG